MQGDGHHIGIIGPGRLGSSLAAALVAAGYPLTALAGTSRDSAHELAAALEAGIIPYDTPQDCADAADLVFLCVPDARVSSLAAGIRWRNGQMIVHCSGALGLEALDPVVAAGGIAGCFHPLQTFPSRTPQPGRFAGVSIGIESAGALREALELIAGDIGARTFRLEGVDRALYHAAAVVSSNLVVALASVAGRLWELAGLPADRSREALAPLTLAAAENIGRFELAEALTGPVARGDVTTVERHLQGMEKAPELGALYRALSAELLRLPLPIPEESRLRLLRLFESR